MKRVKSMKVSTARSSGRTVRKFRVGEWIIEVTRRGWRGAVSVDIRVAGKFPNLFNATGESCLVVARVARNWHAERLARQFADIDT